MPLTLWCERATFTQLCCFCQQTVSRAHFTRGIMNSRWMVHSKVLLATKNRAQVSCRRTASRTTRVASSSARQEKQTHLWAARKAAIARKVGGGSVASFFVVCALRNKPQNAAIDRHFFCCFRKRRATPHAHRPACPIARLPPNLFALLLRLLLLRRSFKGSAKYKYREKQSTPPRQWTPGNSSQSANRRRMEKTLHHGLKTTH